MDTRTITTDLPRCPADPGWQEDMTGIFCLSVQHSAFAATLYDCKAPDTGLQYMSLLAEETNILPPVCP
jgi:hypothetical protein